MSTSRKIINLAPGTNPADAVTLSQLQGFAAGIDWKDGVVAASTVNVTISNPGITVMDGVTLNNGDRVLLKNQTTASQNGVYIYNGSAVAMTRATDFNTDSSALNAIVTVGSGGTTNGGTAWRQTVTPVTLGTTSLSFSAFASTPAATETTAGILEIATQAETDAGTVDNVAVTPLKLKTSTLVLKKFSQTIGDGSSTAFALTHNLNTRDVKVEVYNASTFETVFVDVVRTSVNVVTVTFGSAPASNSYRAVIIG